MNERLSPNWEEAANDAIIALLEHLFEVCEIWEKEWEENPRPIIQEKLLTSRKEFIESMELFYPGVCQNDAD